MPGPRGSAPKQVAKPKNLAKTALRVFSYLADSKKKKLVLALVLVLVIFAALSTVTATFLLTPAINEGILPYVGQPFVISNFTRFIGIVVIMGIVYVIGAISSWLYNFIMIRLAASAMYKIREDLFDAVEDLPLSYFDTHKDGDIMSRFTNDVDSLREALSMAVPQIMSSALTIIGTFIMMVYLSWQLSLIIVIMLIVMIIVLRIVGSQSSRGFKAQQKALGAVNGYIEEMISGQKVVKVFNHEEQVESDFNELNENLRKASTRANTFGNILMPIMGNLSYFQFAICSGVGGYLIIKGAMTIGAIASFLQYSRNFSQPITQVSQLSNTILTALAGAERIFTVIDTPPEEDEGVVELVNVCERPNGGLDETDCETQVWAWKIPQADGTFKYNKINGDVRFKDVSFSYDGKREILHDISLFAKPGQKIAFVGSTGAGKTTITNLLNRFYEIDSGEIIYDGVNIKDIKKEDLRKSLAMVLQDTHLFTGTIRDNIRYGKLDATDHEIEGAANLAHATHFINQLPDGFDTVISGDGGNLSQGQRQLLAIARAAVANPPVLVLDEATSSIDTMTEKFIEKGMDALMADRTTFVIAHRLSTVRNSDAIMVLDQGEIIERGDHDDLMEQKGRYYELQTGALELD